MREIVRQISRFRSELYHRKLAIPAFKNSPRRNQISPAFEHLSKYEKVEPYHRDKENRIGALIRAVFAPGDVSKGSFHCHTQR